MKKKVELTERNTLFEANLSKVIFYIISHLLDWNIWLLKLQKQKDQIEAKLKESSMIHQTNYSKYQEEFLTALGDIKAVKLTLSKRILSLSQLEEIDVESVDELEQLDQLTQNQGYYF